MFIRISRDFFLSDVRGCRIHNRITLEKTVPNLSQRGTQTHRLKPSSAVVAGFDLTNYDDNGPHHHLRCHRSHFQFSTLTHLACCSNDRLFSWRRTWNPHSNESFSTTSLPGTKITKYKGSAFVPASLAPPASKVHHIVYLVPSLLCTTMCWHFPVFRYLTNNKTWDINRAMLSVAGTRKTRKSLKFTSRSQSVSQMHQPVDRFWCFQRSLSSNDTNV